MKKLLSFVSALLLTASFAVAQQYTITIDEGTVSAPTMPFVNSNAKGWSQTIYPAANLDFSVGGTITKIAYQCSQVAASAVTRDVTIYMVNTAKSVASSNTDWIAVTSSDIVYHNASLTQPTATGWFEITLDTPFEYTGGNLAIIISSDGSAAATAQRYYVNSTLFASGASLFKSGTSTLPATAGTRGVQAPNIKITLTPAALMAMPVDNLSVDPAATTATLSWDVNAFSKEVLRYEVKYAVRDGEETTVVTADATPSHTLTGLTPGTYYTASVRAICGVGDTSSASDLVFLTDCQPYALPWSFVQVAGQTKTYSSFKVDNELPVGFAFPGLATENSGYPQAYQRAYGDNFGIEVKFNTGHPAVVVLPEFAADLSTAMLSFYMNGKSGIVEYGYVTDAADSTTFNALGTVEGYEGTTVADFEELGAVIPGSARLAFRCIATGSGNYSNHFGNITVEPAPACKRPSGLAVDASTVTTNSFKLVWGGSKSVGDEYHVTVIKNIDKSLIGTYTTTNQEQMITGLTLGTDYDLYVSKHCTEGDVETDSAYLMYATLGEIAISCNNDAYGVVNGSATGVVNQYAHLTATPNPHYSFDHWYFNNATTYTENPLTGVRYGNVLRPLVAYFTPDNHTVTVTSNNDSYGTVSASAASADYGTSVTLTATPVGSATFVGWSDGNSNLERQLTVTGDMNVQGVFAPDGSTVAKVVLSNPGHATYTAKVGGSNVPADGIVAGGSSVQITVTVDANYSVTAWTGLRGGNTPTYNEATRTYTVTHVADANAVIGVTVSPLSYELALGANDGTLGSLQGAGYYEYGTTAYATAVPNDHCAFVKWADGNTDNPRSLVIGEDTELTAVFEKDSFTVSTTINIAGAATVDIMDALSRTTEKYAYGDMVWITATPAEHYIFSRWAKGTTSASNAAHHFLVYEDQTWNLIMNVEQKTITGQVQSPADGTVTPASVTANWNSTVTLTANDGEHYTFSQWTDGDMSNPRTVTVTDNATYTAQYTPNNYTVSVTTDGNGSAAASGDASHSYAYATTATLSATPNPGYHFLYWTDAEDNIVSTSASYSPVVEGNATYKANFEQTEYTVIITSMTGGAIEGGNITILNAHYGDPISATLTIANPSRYTHTGWSGISGHGTENPLTFTVTENMTIEAIIGDADKITVTAAVNDPSMGSATGSGQYYANDEVVTLTATPNSHYHFVGWTPGNITSNPYLTTVSAPLSLTANFAIDTHMVSVTSSDYTMGSAYGAGQYAYGSVQTITAVPAAGHSLTGWTITRTGESPKDTTGTGLVLNLRVSANTTVRANFEINTYTLTLAGENVSLTGAGDYTYGTAVNISATPAANYDFEGWSDGNAEASRTVTVLDNMTLTALTSQHDYEMTALTADAVMGNASVNYATRHIGQLATFTAEPNTHYRFVQWNDGNSTSPRDITVEGDLTLTASFEPVHYTTVLVDAAAAYGVVATASDTAAAVYGSELEFTATPNAGVEFVSWTVSVEGGSTTTYTANPLNLVLRGNTTVTAAFDSIDYIVTIASNDVEMGTVEPGGSNTYKYGATVSPVATVRTGMEDAYKFVSWGDGETNAAHSAITVTSDMTLTAIFGDKDKYTVAVVSNNDDWGTATVDGATSVSKLNNETVTLAATANSAEHYRFVKWNDGNTDNPRTVTVHDNAVYTAIFALEQYELTISSVENGTVSGATTGTYDYGTEFRLFAQADEHHHFAKWSDDNTDNPRDIAVTGDATYTAVFGLDTFVIAATYENATVEGTGTYNYGDQVTLSATPAANYHFVRWTKNGVEVTTASSTSFTATENATYVAEVAKDQYTLTVASANTAFGSVAGSPSGSYDFDQSIKVWAVPAAHYHFVNWNDNNTLDEDTITEVMNSDLALTATFAIDVYNVNVAAGANGTVNSEINGTHNYGELVTLVATPTTSGYIFDHWSDNYSTDNPRTEAVVGNINATAVFVMEDYALTLSVNDAEMGATSITAGEHQNGLYNYGDAVTIKASVLNSNLYKFLSWNDGVTDSVRTINMTGDAEYKALFGRLDMLTVNALSNNNAWGTVVSSATSVNLNDEVTLTATPAEHYHLVGWSDIEGYNTDLVRNDVHITSDTIITAIFAIDTFNIDIAMTANGASVSGIGSYTYGSTVSIYAEAEEHAHFMYWSGDANGTANPMTVTVNDDMNIVANFERDMVRIQAMAQNGSVSRADTNVYYGEGFALTATADEHYSNFKGWTRNGVAVEGAETITVDATSDAIYQAVFAIDSFMLSVNVNDPTMGSVNGPVTGKYPYGTVMLFVAVPANHYHFEGWTGDFEAPETLIGFEMTQDYDILASFAINTHQLTVGIEDGDEELGTVNSGVSGTYAYGTSINVTAMPNDGFSFTRWSDGQTAATRTITMGENDIDIKADFDTIYYNVNVVVNNDTMGEILGAQNAYVWHDVVTFTAHIFDTNRFKFIGWSDGQHGLDTVRTDTIEGDLNLTAIFTDKEKLSVYVQSNNQAWGTAAASENSVNINHTVTLTATAAADHHFVAWMNGEDTVSTDVEYTFAVTENVNYTAIFATDRHQVILANEDGHAVALTGSGEYDWNETVVISAEAEEHYEFVNWTDENGNEVGNSNPYTFAMQSADTTIVANFQLKTYTLTLVAENGGSVEGAGDYTALDYATITATAAHNYTFGAWMKDGDTVSTDTSFNVQMLGNATYTATFVEDPLYTIALQSENLSMGTVNSVAATHEGDEVNIVATPKNHYHFVKWVDANDTSVVFGTEQDTTFVASENLNLVAMFHIDMVALTLQSDGNGELTGAGEYEYGQTVVLGNEPAEHYHLNKWYSEGNDSIASTPTLSVRVVSDTTIHADFVLNTYTITVNAENGHNAIGSGSYTAHDFVTISAEANDNYHFYSWRKNGLDIAGGEELEIEVLGNDTYTAVYSENDAFRVYVQSANLSQGTVEGNAAYHVDNVATVTATPKEHHHFMNWTNNAGEVLSTEAEFSFVVESDTTLTANFAIDTHHVVLTNNLDSNIGEGDFPYGASVSFNAGTPEGYHFMRFENAQGDTLGLTTPMNLTIVQDTLVVTVYAIDTIEVTLEAENGEIETDTLRYIWGSEATFTAVAAEHYHFLNWNNDVEEPTLNVNIYSDTTITAIFELDTHLVTLPEVEHGMMEGEGYFGWNTIAPIKAIADEHYHLVGWSDIVGYNTTAERNINVTSDTTITAIFAIDTHEVTLEAENGTIFYDTLRYTYGATAEFTYEPAENYHFVGWMVDGVDAGNADTLSFSVEGDAVVEALFSIDSYSFTVSSNDMAKGYVTGTQNGTYDNGDAIEVVAHANQYNVFVGWMSGEDTISTNDTLGFNIVSDTAITAVFASELFSINAEANDTAMGSVEGTGMFTFHSLATLTAVPAEGHHFVMWSDSLTTVSRMIYVEQDTNLVAYFAIDTHYVAVVVNDTAMGSVTGEGWYNWGDTVTLKATPNAHFNFLGFNGSTNHIDSISFVVTEDVTVTANFDYQYLKIYSNFENGNVGIEVAGVQANTNTMPVIAHYGDSIVMTATANEHYHFVNWVEYSISYDTTMTIDTTYITESTTEMDPTTGEAITIVDTLETVIDTNMVVTPVYTADTTYDDAQIGYHIYSDRYIDAVFEINEVTLQLLGMHAELIGAGTYNAGDSVTVSATVEDHYVFIGWSDGTTDTIGGAQNIIDSNLSYTFVIEEDMVLWAITEGELVTVTLSASPEAGGVVIGEGTYHYGDVVSIRADANEGYTFENWTRGDGVTITTAEYSFTVVEDVAFVANFHKVGIDNVDQTDISVYAYGDVIYVKGAENQTIRIYDAVGRMVSSSMADGEDVKVRMEASGIYMVQVGNNRAQRVMIVR